VQLPAAHEAIVIFTVASHPYAVPTARTREVVAWRAARPLPGAPSWVEGVINLRGQIIPVCDLAAALGVGERGTPTLDTSIIIIERGTECIGFVVDAVRAVTPMGSDAVVEAGASHHPAVTGIIRREGELIVLLDADVAVAESAAFGIANLDALVAVVSDETAAAAALAADAQPAAPAPETALPTHPMLDDARRAA
jgi:purine-binding chemotaxis protein CheW